MAKKCSHCRYRCSLGSGIYCQYILITRHMRGCDIQKCDKYKAGTPYKEEIGEEIDDE